MNATNEQLQEKKAILEQELKRINLELASVLNLNDTLALENKEKDETIGLKEHQLIVLQEKNSQEIEQYLQERTCLEDSFSHDVDVINDAIKKLLDLKNRYDNIEAENSLLASSTEKLKKKMALDSLAHAELLHNINRNMRTMRQEMEATFRKELVEMDLHFQLQAFTAMDDEKKKAMLANSKLKDELALQSVGISNLGVRCGRDKQHYKDIKNKMKSTGQQVNARRNKLTDLQMKKMRSGLNICTFESELEVAIEKEMALKLELDQWPSYDELDEVEMQLEAAVSAQQQQLAVWSERLNRALVIESDYKRSNFINKFGQSTVSIDIAASTNTATKGVLSDKVDSMATARTDALAQIKATDHSADLEEALQPIRGKEATLLPAGGTASACVSQIIQILKSKARTESSCFESIPDSEGGVQGSKHALLDAEHVKTVVDQLKKVVSSHVGAARASTSVSNAGLLEEEDENVSTTSQSLQSTTSMEVSGGLMEDRKWLGKPPSFDNALATSNVLNIGNSSKLPKTKFTDVFLPEGVSLDPPLLSNDLLEKLRLSASSSAPTLRSKTTSCVLDDASAASFASRRSKKSSGNSCRREDPLASSKVKHSQRSLSTITLRAKDRKAEKIIQLMAQSYSASKL